MAAFDARANLKASYLEFSLLPFYGEGAKGRQNGNVVLGNTDAPWDSLDRFGRLPL